MATLLTCKNLSKHYGSRDLFVELSIGFDEDEHVGLLGPNGSGKSTFLKMIAGLVDPDSGELNRRRGARIGYLPQEDVFPTGETVEAVLSAALADIPIEPHERDTRVAITCTQFGFPAPSQRVDTLSGGWKKRLAIAREVIRRPDLLLLDEPTNHLDIEGIEALEELLSERQFAFLVVSHDRYFLERVTDRVVELNPVYPDGFFSVSGSYSAFLDKRAEFLDAQQAQQATLANIVRRENAFLKSNSKAQRSKSKVRIEEAYKLQDQLAEVEGRNSLVASAGIEFAATGRKSRKLLVGKRLTKSLGGRLLFKDADVELAPGTRLGILGLNGSGKSTLIRVLTGKLPPDAGTIETADELRVVVFDQMREQLPMSDPLRTALAGNSDSVTFGGREIHVSAWARRFLFKQDQLEMLLNELSGGERARIQIARLMLKPADVLVLDEPTNDLDIHSLDVLEESLLEFPGAIVLVTHDRFMLDRVCNEIVSLDGDGEVGRYASCGQWQAARARRAREAAKAVEPAASKKSGGKSQGGKLSASEQKELRNIEASITAAEAAVEAATRATEDPSIGHDHVELQKRWSALDAAKAKVAAVYARWELLEAKASANA
ncbi:MAG: ABC-F family ATP-binding cassette domain-containing protein [Phycisphaerae bacterium]